MLPHDFPPRKTFSYGFYTWRDGGVWEHVYAGLREEMQGADGKEPTPGGCIVDSHSVKANESCGPKG